MCHTLVGLGCLCETGQPHAAQHMRCLRELDVVVADDLDAVAPRVEEIEEAARQHAHSRLCERLTRRLLVIDHDTEMPPVVTGLLAAFLQGDELVTKIDECGMLTLAAQAEFEEVRVEGKASSMSPTSSEMWFSPRARALLVFGMAVVSRFLW